MNRSDVGLLFDHLYWMRDRILEAGAAPSVELADPAPPTIRDFRSTLVHELDVEWSWRQRLRGRDPTSFPPDDVELDPADFQTLDAVRTRWAADEIGMRDWLAGLSDADLAGPCRAERGRAHPLWFHLLHLYTHAVQQFSDAAVLITRSGRSPGQLDFLQFVEDRERSAARARDDPPTAGASEPAD